MAIELPSLSLGGNVFGWTADEAQSFAVLDAARDAGIHFVDTADVYAAWINGGKGGQSETILGRWIADRGARDETIVATKVGMRPGFDDLRPGTLKAGLDESLGRLQLDTVDLFYAHKDDGGDLVETLATFDGFVKEGKIRAIGLSNFSAERLREALDVAEREGFAKPSVLQPKYSLVERDYETDEQEVAAYGQLAVVPYYALASGFLTGKYRPGGADTESARAGSASAYLGEPRGPAVLEALDAVAEAHEVEVASVALAWLRAQPTVVAPLASARTVEQVAPLAASLTLELTPDELASLTAASETGVNA
ncbi:MAG: aldo/keto reductase [Solirubrobacteraceae bacterium]|nr:aldo/keto reductase [Solirubrobacteraceae bacterium]